jgi:integrase
VVLEKRLTHEMEQTLISLFANPLQGLLRKSDEGSRIRNILMLRILYELGMRRGELLSLKLRNFHEGTAGEGPSLIVERNHHDEFDIRIHQPVAKTNGRVLKISCELEVMIKEYLYDYRSELPLSGLDDEDFIFVNHRNGPRQGQPLSISSFDSALGDLKIKFQSLDGLHPHLLRHHWNWRYSKLPRAEGYTEASDMMDRCYLMGWAHNSESAKIYNLIHIMEEANRKGLFMNMDTARLNKIT